MNQGFLAKSWHFEDLTGRYLNLILNKNTDELNTKAAEIEELLKTENE